MKKVLVAAATILMTNSAFAADAMSEGPAPAAPYSWSGFYAGISAGYAGGDVNVHDTNGGVTPGPFSYSPNGGIGSGQVGYNFEFNSLVVGIEGDLGYMGFDGNGTIGSASAASHQDLTLDGGLYGDVTGRVGYAFGPALLYGKGGLAFFDGEAKQTTTSPGYVTTGTDTFTGWTLGAGLEYLLTQQMSVKLEYQHFDFGSQGGNQTNVGDLSSPIGFEFQNDTELKVETVKIGLNYRF